MVARAAALVLVASAAVGCGGQEQGRVDPDCLASREVYLQALETAPERAVLRSGTTISECAGGARSDGDLQEAGVQMVQAADALALRAQDGDPRAAVQLGFLAGAVERGAATSQGIQAELARRVVRAGALLGPEVEDDFLRGLDAGRQRG